jgi:hypothetical protein
MPDLLTNYVIEPSPHAVSHPRLYKVASISGVEVSRQEVSFLEFSLAEPELFAEFLSQFKAYILGYAESIDVSLGVDALKEETLRSFEKGIMYAASQSRSSDI